MTVWSTGGLSGFDGTLVEITGRVIGKRPGHWYFHDGEGKRWLPKEHIRSYVYLRDGYCIVRIPSWLAKRRRFLMKRTIR